jgi:acyl-CoA synthetase (NDP forming)
VLPPLPPYAFPETAVRAIGHAAAYGAWRRHPAGSVQRPSEMDTATRTVAVRALAAHPDGCWLDPDDIADLLAGLGVPCCQTEHAGTADEAVEAAERLGLPVVLKTAATLARKTELGGVRTDLADPVAVRAAYDAIAAAISSAGVLVQPMARSGVELLVGISRTEPYPPVLLVGLGGTATALLGDTATRLAPVTDADTHDMIRELQTAPLLLGYRGAAPADVAAVEDLLQRIGTLADEVPEIVELDLNPVIVGTNGLMTVDAKVRVAPIGADHDLRHDPLLRRLR